MKDSSREMICAPLEKSIQLFLRLKVKKILITFSVTLFDDERAIVMRAADAIEKITRDTPSYLHTYKNEIVGLCHETIHKELKWHLALLIPWLCLNHSELLDMWKILERWS
ncbi:MAG TPA: hypothetical protein VFP87_02800 [Chitinophagaceae bacterium]|nr:hypothetical protein [Chitinophagaceae bacterium]